MVDNALKLENGINLSDQSHETDSSDEEHAKTALLAAILNENGRQDLDSVTEQELVRGIAMAIAQWQALDDDSKSLVWKASRNRTAIRKSVHPVLEQLQVMAGERPNPDTGERVQTIIPESVYQLASDTFLLMLYHQESSEA